MEQRAIERVGAIGAAVVAALSLLYAVAYLVIAPAAQRRGDVDRFYRSHLAHPAGLRIASVCLLLSGLLSGLVVTALAERLRKSSHPGLLWASILGVAAGLATAAHGLGDLVGVDTLAHRFAGGDTATRAAIAVAHVSPSAVDPRAWPRSARPAWSS